jgi:hypothetical protein
MAVKRPSEKNTKAEILTAFNDLWKEKKELEAQFQAAKQSELKANAKSTPDVSTMATPMSINPPRMETIIEELTQLQLKFGGAISDLSEKLTLEAVQLQDVRQAVATEIEQLETLHQLQINDDSLDTLVQQYGDSFKAFSEELNQRRDSLEQEFVQAKKAWAKAQEEHRRSLKDRNETIHKTQQREEKEYIYDLTLQRQLSADQFAQSQKRLDQELEELQQAQTKQWAAREQAIADREAEFAELKAKVEAYPKELEAAIKRAKEEGKGIAQHQAKIKADLIAKEIEGQKHTYQLRIQSLLDTIQHQESRLQHLAHQLDAALKQVQDLAVKAIEGSANVSSAQMLKEIALEQAKTQTKNK